MSTRADALLGLTRDPRAVLGAAAVLRIILSLYSASLQNRPELTSPLTSLRSLKEGVFLYNHGLNPYDGGVFYHSPIYLALFSIIPVRSTQFTTLTWILADLIGALALMEICRTRRVNQAFAAALYALPWLSLISFLYNPYTIGSCLAKSTTSLDNALALVSLAGAVLDQPLAGVTLAMSTFTSLYPILLLPSLLMITNSKPSFAAAFVLSFGACYAACTAVFGTSWLKSPWGAILTVSDLAPNVGMWWYFFTEMFDHFRDFFLGVFQLHVIIYVAPVCIRLRHDPLLGAIVIVGIISTWKSYPTLGDLGLWAGLLGCLPEITSHLRHPLFTLTVYLYTLILLPLLHSLWLLTGTGNANFFYAATMVHGLNTCLAIVDVLGAGIKTDLQRNIEKDNPSAAEKIKSGVWSIVQFTRADA